MNKQKLPEGWKEVELGNTEYFTILSSGINSFEGKKDYLSTESVQGTRIKKIECTITYINRPSRANMQPVLNSVWFAKMQSTLKVYSFNEENKDKIKKYILSTGFAGIKVNEDLVSSKYLRLLLTSKDFNELKDKLCTGSTQRGINNKFIEKIPLIIPPLETQKKIVSILEKAEKAKEWRKEADELTKDFLKSLFLEMFGDPRVNPKGWNTFKFDQLGTLARGKSKHRPRNDPKLLGGKHPLIQTGGVANSGRYIREYTQTYSDLGLEQSRIWSKGTLCITIAANIAMTGILTFNACFPDSIVGFTPNKKTRIEYIQYWLSFLQKILENSAPESAQKNINLKILSGLDVPLPPISLQNKFASIVKEVEAMKEQQKQSKDQINSLFNALMQKAFKGELVI